MYVDMICTMLAIRPGILDFFSLLEIYGLKKDFHFLCSKVNGQMSYIYKCDLQTLNTQKQDPC